MTIIGTGMKMLTKFAGALNTTHKYLHRMGAKVAPDKSYNSASTKVAMDWLRDIWWEGIRSNIEAVNDFRYLGAHLTVGSHCNSATQDKRWQKACSQLKKLRFVPATTEAKVRAIHAKVYASAMYGIEAAAVTPAKIATLAASVIDVFRSTKQ